MHFEFIIVFHKFYKKKVVTFSKKKWCCDTIQYNVTLTIINTEIGCILLPIRLI
jgi:hypothetical protein